MAYPNPPSDPAGTGIASFLGAFGNQLGKEKDKETSSEGKEALERLKDYFKTKEAEDPNKVRPMINPNGPQKVPAGAANKALNDQRRVLKSVQEAENKLEGFRAKLMNAMDTTVDHTHYNAFLKENMAKGLPVQDAINRAVNQAFTANDPNSANLIAGAHKNGMVANLLKNSQLANEFPILNDKYGQPVQTPATPKPSANPNSGAPSLPSPQPKPQQTSMAPPIKLPPQQPQAAPNPQMASLPQNAGAGPQPMPNVPTNTPVPGQGDEEPSV